MAIYVKIRKLFEKNEIGFYEISKESGDSNNLYMSIDRKNRLIRFYLKNNFSNLIHEVNCNQDKPIGSIPGITMITYSRALIQAIKTLDMDKFPEVLDYAA